MTESMDNESSQATGGPAETGGGPADTGDPTDDALRALQESLRQCDRCGLCAGRTQVVFGVGSPHAQLMFVGEGPGFNEDKQGEPFVGAAGKYLNELLGGIGLSRADIYIANVVKCRPPDNRDPLPDEIAACSPHLLDQIAIIKPKVICTLGRFATKLLAETELSMTAIHGKAKPLRLAGVDLVVFPVFHPAAALYNPANRQVLELDFAKLRHLLTHGLGPRYEQAVDDEATAAAAAAETADAAPAAELTPPSPAARPPARGSNPAADHTEQLPLW